MLCNWEGIRPRTALDILRSPQAAQRERNALLRWQRLVTRLLIRERIRASSASSSSAAWRTGNAAAH